MTSDAAWRQAVVLRDAPETLFALRTAPLPEGMTALIRLASGTGADADTAVAYLQTVCLYAGSPPWRCLGLPPDADPTLAKEHHRLLIKWLHPDRNPEARVLAERVNAAWHSLKGGALPVPRPTAPPRPRPRARSRFPLFLVGLVAATAGLLALSLWPQAAVYPDLPVVPQTVMSDAPASLAATTTATTPAPAAPAATPVSIPPDTAVAGVAPSVAVNPVATPVVANWRMQLAALPAAMADVPPAMPDDAVAAAPPVAEIAAAPDRAQGEVLLGTFEQRYRDGDLAAFMVLFSAEASSGPDDIADIRRDYRRLFQRTRSREIAFSQARWRMGDDTLSVRLRYRTELGYGGSHAPAVRHGGLELAMALEDGQPRIVQYLLLE